MQLLSLLQLQFCCCKLCGSSLQCSRFFLLPLQKYLYVSKKLVVVFTFGAVQNKLLLLFKCFIIVVDSSAVFCQQCFDTPVQLGFEDRFQNRLAVFRFGDQKPSEFSLGQQNYLTELFRFKPNKFCNFFGHFVTFCGQRFLAAVSKDFKKGGGCRYLSSALAALLF